MYSKPALSAALAVCLTCFAATQIDAQTRTRITALDSQQGDLFGWSVAISGDVALVGTTNESPSAAYLFRSNGTDWVQEAKLTPTPSFGAAGRYFEAADMDGDLAVATIAGYPFSEDGGAAYVFRFNGESWVEEARLAPVDVVPGDGFGFRVAVSSAKILIGAGNQDDGNGAAYVFSHDGSSWQQEAKLVDPNPGVLDRFGLSVALDGDVAVIGSYTSDNGLIESGSAHVFRYDGSDWNYEAKLVAPDAQAYDHFSRRVAIDEDWIFVGTLDNDAGEGTGSVHAYRWDGSEWIHAQKILADDAHAQGYFGFDISLSGDRAIISGSIEESVFYSFVFDGERWVQEAKYGQCEDVQCEQNDLFGEYVDISGNRAIISSREENGDAGAVYIYELGPVQTRAEREIPSDFDQATALRQNFPNPVSQSATITFRLLESGPVRLTIVDLLGRERSVLIDRDLKAGKHRAKHVADALESGTYFYRLSTSTNTETKSFIIVR